MSPPSTSPEYLAGKLDAIHADVVDIKRTMVTKEICDGKHERTDDEIRRAFGVARGAAAAAARLKEDTSPGLKVQSFDFWSWAGKRLPVVLMLLTLGGAIYLAKWTVDTNASRSTANAEALDTIRRMVQNNKPAPIPYPVPVVTSAPDAGPRRKRPR